MNHSSYHEEIARQAYLLYQARGMMPGGDLADWLEAERLCNGRGNSGTHRDQTQNGTQPPQREPASPFRENGESMKDTIRGKRRRASRDEVRTNLPHPAARLTPNRDSEAATTR